MYLIHRMVQMNFLGTSSIASVAPLHMIAPVRRLQAGTNYSFGVVTGVLTTVSYLMSKEDSICLSRDFVLIVERHYQMDVIAHRRLKNTRTNLSRSWKIVSIVLRGNKI